MNNLKLGNSEESIFKFDNQYKLVSEKEYDDFCDKYSGIKLVNAVNGYYLIGYDDDDIIAIYNYLDRSHYILIN